MGILVAMETCCAIQIYIIFGKPHFNVLLNMCADFKSINTNLTTLRRKNDKIVNLIDFVYQNYTKYMILHDTD